MDDFFAGFVSALVLIFVVTVIVIEYTDLEPVEKPFYEHCETFDSTLKSYDGKSFTCKNGANFKRSIVEEK